MLNQGVSAELEMKICFPRQSWTKDWRQIHEITENSCFCEMVYSWFFAFFYRKTWKFGFWVDGSVLAIKSKHFRDFLEISWFPKILILKEFNNSWGNSYIHFLVKIIQLPFTCGEEKLSTNVLSKIVCMTF